MNGTRRKMIIGALGTDDGGIDAFDVKQKIHKN